MAGKLKKRWALAVVSDRVAFALDKVSKAALIDLYVQALAANLGACDTPPTLEQVKKDADPTLAIRNDRPIRCMPFSRGSY